MNMADNAKQIYVIQKLISATSIHDALARESEAKIVEVTMTDAHAKKLNPAVGFFFKTDEGDITQEE